MRSIIMFSLFLKSVLVLSQPEKLIPKIEGEGWKITGTAKLKSKPGREIDVVDHSFIKRGDGKWMVWAAVRNAIPDHPFYAWEATSLTDKNWKDLGIAATASATYGEDTTKGIYAPHFVKIGNKYYCYYTSEGLFLMESEDGKSFKRYRDKRGNYELAEKLVGRDVMIFQEEGKYYAFSCISTFDRKGWHQGQVIVTFAKYQTDPLDWQYPEFSIVNQGGQGGNGHVSSESPFVVKMKGYYYLFRASSMTFKTYVYRSDNLFDFGTNTDAKLVAVLPLKAPELIEENGQWFISDLDDFRGLKLYKLKWEKE